MDTSGEHIVQGTIQLNIGKRKFNFSLPVESTNDIQNLFDGKTKVTISVDNKNISLYDTKENADDENSTSGLLQLSTSGTENHYITF